MKMYKVYRKYENGWGRGTIITEIEVCKKTNKSYVLFNSWDASRHSLFSEDSAVFETEDEAIAFVIKDIYEKIEKCNNEIKWNNKFINNMLKLKEEIVK